MSKGPARPGQVILGRLLVFLMTIFYLLNMFTVPQVGADDQRPPQAEGDLIAAEDNPVSLVAAES